MHSKRITFTRSPGARCLASVTTRQIPFWWRRPMQRLWLVALQLGAKIWDHATTIQRRLAELCTAKNIVRHESQNSPFARVKLTKHTEAHTCSCLFIHLFVKLWTWSYIFLCFRRCSLPWDSGKISFAKSQVRTQDGETCQEFRSHVSFLLFNFRIIPRHQNTCFTCLYRLTVLAMNQFKCKAKTVLPVPSAGKFTCANTRLVSFRFGLVTVVAKVLLNQWIRVSIKRKTNA